MCQAPVRLRLSPSLLGCSLYNIGATGISDLHAAWTMEHDPNSNTHLNTIPISDDTYAQTRGKTAPALACSVVAVVFVITLTQSNTGFPPHRRLRFSSKKVIRWGPTGTPTHRASTRARCSPQHSSSSDGGCPPWTMSRRADVELNRDQILSRCFQQGGSKRRYRRRVLLCAPLAW